MLTRTQITLIVIAVVIIILFAITYFILFQLAFTSRIKLVKYGYEDEKVINHLKKKYNKFIRKNDPSCFVDKYLNRANHNTLYTVVVDILIFIITVICTVFIGIGLYFRLNDQQMFINGKSFLVVETGSMSEKHPDNKYLVDYNLNNQIKARSLIQIAVTNDYQVYDVCAFKIDDKIVVHRIIEIKEKDGKKFYRFKGDANPYSLPDEFEVSEDRIIGEFCCLKSVFLGTSILFLQSGIGMISILVSLIIYALYTAYYDKDTRAFEERTDVVLKLYYDDMHKVYDLIEEESNEVLIINIKGDELNYEEVSDDLDTEAIFDTQIVDTLTIDENINPFANLVSLSYPEKMIKNELLVREYYNELKSYILSYNNITNRISNQYETFKLGLNKLFLLEIRGTKLKLNINVVSGLLDEKYHLKDNTTKKLEDYPVSLKITSNRALKYAKEIVDIVLKDYELSYDYQYKDYMTMLMIDFDKSLTKRYSLFARLSLGEDDVRNAYNELKNLIMSYKDIHDRLSFKGETFTYKYKKLFMIELRGKTLRLHIASDITNYDPKYHMKENGHSRGNDYPGYLKVKSARSLKYAKEIIENFLVPQGYVYEESNVDYLVNFPRLSELDLISIGEIKLRRDSMKK